MLNGRMDALSNCYVSGQHLLIKVNLSGFRALHMDQGCSHLLADCLRLQRDIHGIKRCQGTPSSMRLLIRDEIS